MLSLSVPAAAEALGVSRSHLHRVVSGKSAITPELALRLEAVFGSTAEAWLRLQTAYDVARVRNRAGEITQGLHKITRPAA